MNLGRGTIGGQPAAPPSPAEVAAMRVAAARRNRHWQEIEDDLIRRPPRYWVSAASDEVFRAYRGAVFNRGGGVAFAEDRPLVFVIRDDDVLLLEPVGRTWSEMFGEQLQPPPKRRKVRR